VPRWLGGKHFLPALELSLNQQVLRTVRSSLEPEKKNSKRSDGLFEFI